MNKSCQALNEKNEIIAQKDTEIQALKYQLRLYKKVALSLFIKEKAMRNLMNKFKRRTL